MIWKLRTELDFPWDIVQDEIRDVFHQLLATVSEQFEALQAAISAISTPSEFHTQLSAVIGPRIETCKYRLALAQEKLARDVK